MAVAVRRTALLAAVGFGVLIGSIGSNILTRDFFVHVQQQQAAAPKNINTSKVLPILAPPVPDSVPTEMIKRAFTRKNGNIIPHNDTSSCDATSQVRILPGQQSWILQSLAMDGADKSTGGDEYYITYTDDSSNGPTAIAFVKDRHDGSYELRFVTSPSLDTSITQLSSTGTVTIVLQYSCGLGRLAPPRKARWITGGAINSRYIIANMTMPPMDPFVPPTGIDLGQYDRVVAFGDSTMQNLVEHNESSSNIFFPGNVWAPLNTITVNKRIVLGPENDWRSSDSFVKQIKTHVTRTRAEFQNVALIMGSGAWDLLQPTRKAYNMLQGAQFKDHRAACRLLIELVRREFPGVDLYWKSHTAMHIHRVAEHRKDWYRIRRVYYMSTSRSYDLYRYQKEIMEELNVTMLDLYPVTYLSAVHTKLGDGRHYTEAFNKKILDWFYPN